MSIRQRGGYVADLEESKLVAREIVSPFDGPPRVCQSPGVVKTLLTSEDANDIIALAEEMQTQLDNLNALIISKTALNDSVTSTTQGWSSDKITKFATNTNTVAFIEATTLANIATTETHATMFGKIKKFFTFIGTTALQTTAQTISGAIGELRTIIGWFRSNFAPTYSASSTYAVGKYVIYADSLYKCITAITVAEAWNVAKWSARSVGAELETANGNITTINTNLESSISVSTSEHVVGKWIDGKPLYRKTYDIGALPNATDKFTAHGISNLKIIARIYGSATTNDGYSIPLPYSNSVKVSTSPTNITVTTINNESAYMRSYVTLEYTKTTD